MLRHNAIEAWQTMQKTVWRRCPPSCALRSEGDAGEGTREHSVSQGAAVVLAQSELSDKTRRFLLSCYAYLATALIQWKATEGPSIAHHGSGGSGAFNASFGVG